MFFFNIKIKLFSVFSENVKNVINKYYTDINSDWQFFSELVKSTIFSNKFYNFNLATMTFCEMQTKNVWYFHYIETRRELTPFRVEILKQKI